MLTSSLQCALEIGAARFASRRVGQGEVDGIWRLLCLAIELPWSALRGGHFSLPFFTKGLLKHSSYQSGWASIHLSTALTVESSPMSGVTNLYTMPES